MTCDLCIIDPISEDKYSDLVVLIHTVNILH